MIPKTIHYCWFGRNEKSRSMIKCIESWKKYCPDYEIIEWNEDNFNIDCIPFVKEAYNAKKWAFVTDYARLRIVYENGGIYLDTDVELLKSLDDFLLLEAYAGFQTDGLVNTGLGFGAEKGNKVIFDILSDYNDRSFPADLKECEKIACPIINTKVLESMGLVPDGSLQTVSGMTVFPKEYFDPKNNQTYELKVNENTYSIHHYDATWKSKNAGLKHRLIRFVVSIIGEDNFIKLKNKLKK
ncbi:MAG: glycosyl transferase [Clostridia bacterium]|nr:glycosyl transferase [Clostridia bacterium]